MIKKELNKRRLNLSWLVIGVLAMVFVTSTLAQAEPNDPVLPDPNMPEEPRLPGTVEGTGTYFEVTDSNYLNIMFESSEPVSLMLESVPEMIVMDINSVEGATSTQITLTGFPPSTTYYKYEDDYHNEVTFTTDDNGTYTFAQDLTQPHLVFIQPNPGTIFIPSDTSIGTWDPVNRIYTLTTDVYETIQIDEDNLTLDGAGRTVGPGSGYGFYLYGRTGVTIKNVNVEGFSYGIYIYNSRTNTLADNTSNYNSNSGIYLGLSSDNTLRGNKASNNGAGISIHHSNDNTLTANTASSNILGIRLYYSSGNTLKNNTANSNYELGIYIHHSTFNTLTGNITSNNRTGIRHGFSNASNLTGNITRSNSFIGIQLLYSSNNTLTDNTNSNNAYGIHLYQVSDNQIYNNNFINNEEQMWIGGRSSSGNVFNLDRPIGGNFWSDWTSPDDDGDGFVDYPYIIPGWPHAQQDNLPWTHAIGFTLLEVDIKPGSYPNAINLGSYGLVPVAILSTEQFDATTVDPDTVELAGAGVEVRGKSNKFMAHEEDVNGDDLLDLLLQVATQNLDPDFLQDGYAILTGETYDGVSIEGADEITIVPPE